MSTYRVGLIGYMDIEADSPAEAEARMAATWRAFKKEHAPSLALLVAPGLTHDRTPSAEGTPTA